MSDKLPQIPQPGAGKNAEKREPKKQKQASQGTEGRLNLEQLMQFKATFLSHPEG
jgi:hypothetical protein